MQVFAELRHLPDKVNEAELVSPTLIFIGHVVALSPSWMHVATGEHENPVTPGYSNMLWFMLMWWGFHRKPYTAKPINPKVLKVKNPQSININAVVSLHALSDRVFIEISTFVLIEISTLPHMTLWLLYRSLYTRIVYICVHWCHLIQWCLCTPMGMPRTLIRILVWSIG